MTMALVKYRGFYPSIKYNMAFLNNLILVSNLFQTARFRCKVNEKALKLNLKSNLLREPLQNYKKRKISLNVFTQCHNKSYNKRLRDVRKLPLFLKISIQILFLPPKCQALTEMWVPFYFTLKFQSRPSENNIQLSAKCTKRFPATLVLFFYLKHFYYFRKHKLL